MAGQVREFGDWEEENKRNILFTLTSIENFRGEMMLLIILKGKASWGDLTYTYEL